MKKQSASSRSGARDKTKKGGTVARKTAAELDALHDAGGDMSAHIDDTKTRRPHREIQRVNVDFPQPMLDEIDRAAGRLGVNRQAFIKMSLADRLAIK
jgi:hypothetical protein